VLATVHLLQKVGLDLLGVPVGPLGLSRDPAADPPFAAGERVATGVDRHLQAVAALKDWWPLTCGFWCLAGLEPAACCIGDGSAQTLCQSANLLLVTTEKQ
jgi:hypothetical protein